MFGIYQAPLHPAAIVFLYEDEIAFPAGKASRQVVEIALNWVFAGTREEPSRLAPVRWRQGAKTVSN
jgi:hypothetical protein